MSQECCSPNSSAIKLNRLILCVVAVFSLAFAQQACGNEEKPSQDTGEFKLSEAKVNDKNISSTNGHRVIVYYFHGKFRCGTCKRIEQLTREAVREFFEDEIGTGKVKLKIVNVEEKGNRHFAKSYQLFTRSVVISDIVNGKEKQWKWSSLAGRRLFGTVRSAWGTILQRFDAVPLQNVPPIHFALTTLQKVPFKLIYVAI